LRTMTILAAALALVLAGCGGSSNKNAGSNTSGAATATSTPASSGGSGGGSGGGGGASGTLALAAPADGSLKFDKTTLTAKAGKVTINFDNPSSTPHGVAVEGNGVDKDSQTVTSSKTSLTVDLKPGKYTFYCPVPGHRQAGMQGTLTVQ
jgi:plastocyanin